MRTTLYSDVDELAALTAFMMAWVLASWADRWS